MKLGIKDGKIYDICSRLEWKRDDSIPDKDYIEDYGDNWIDDIWDFENKVSLKDSPKRFEEPPKTKLEELEAQLTDALARITQLESLKEAEVKK